MGHIECLTCLHVCPATIYPVLIKSRVSCPGLQKDWENKASNVVHIPWSLNIAGCFLCSRATSTLQLHILHSAERVRKCFTGLTFLVFLKHIGESPSFCNALNKCKKSFFLLNKIDAQNISYYDHIYVWVCESILEIYRDPPAKLKRCVVTFSSLMKL